jgi:hypothetical protein
LWKKGRVIFTTGKNSSKAKSNRGLEINIRTIALLPSSLARGEGERGGYF